MPTAAWDGWMAASGTSLCHAGTGRWRGHDQLAAVIRHARRRYFEVADRCAEVLGQALEASGFQTEGIARQRDVFRSLVRTWASEVKTAYLLIDALRYDMGAG
jgi:hypothetical protein